MRELPDRVMRTDVLVTHAFGLARSLGVQQILVQADEMNDIRLIERVRGSESLVWVMRQSALPDGANPSTDIVISLPDGTLTRLSRVHLALLLGVLNGLLDRTETILCLSGIAGSGHLDTMSLTNPSEDLPWLKKLEPTYAAGRHLGRLLTIAVRFASEGREGKPIGTIFVQGDTARLAPYLRQLVLNPCAGHPSEALDIHNPDVFETLREFAAMDGAFVVNGNGIVESAATYLDAPIRNRPLRAGLGARHVAALSATVGTGAVAVVVSSSSGTISVFQDGLLILELAKS
jgi:DNA integrity scanning protein DisA with diadenylate cyclase activity